jgi:hypothetical protein
MGVLWAYYGRTMGILWAYYGRTMDVLWMYYGRTMDVLWLSYDASMGHYHLSIAIYHTNYETSFRCYERLCRVLGERSQSIYSSMFPTTKRSYETEISHRILIQRSTTYNFMSQGLSTICRDKGVSVLPEKHKQGSKSETYWVQDMGEDDGSQWEDDFRRVNDEFQGSKC